MSKDIIFASGLGQEVSSVVERLSGEAQDFLRSSLSRNTRRAYAAQLKLWEAHCEDLGIEPYPASPVTVANWVADRANNWTPGVRRQAATDVGQSVSSLRVAIAAIKYAHTARDLPFDTRDPRLQKVVQGIRQVKAEVPHQSEALQAKQLLGILDGLGDDPIARRDAAILALGFAAARRRSEIVGLDLDKLGDGDGVLIRSATDFRIILVRGKTAAEGDDPIIINREDNREAAKALDLWIDQAGIRAGEPLFRRIRKGGNISPERLDDDYVARIVKARVAEYLVAQGVPEKLASAEAKKYAAHSLRHGFATTAAEAGASTLEIATVTGHRSQAILARYVRQADRNNLRPSRRPGVGLRREA